MFLGNFAGARNDYERMILINSSTEVSHWRLGIAYYYLGLFGKAARQFKFTTNLIQLIGRTESGDSCPNSKVKD